MEIMRVILPTMLLCITTSIFAQTEMVKTTYPGTNLKLERTIETLSDGSSVIREKVYHNNGQLWLDNKIYDNGRINEWTYYYSNGNPFWKALTVENQLEGEYIHWYDNGQVAEIISFDNNVENGKAQFYYPNGELAMEGAYEQGKMIDDWQFFNEDGTQVKNKLWSWLFFDTAELRMQGRIKNNKMQGHWEYTETANADKPYRRQFYLKYQDGELTQ